MAIKSGQFLHDANGFVVDSIQSGGASSLNIPEEKIKELGNYKTVATVRDTPDLSFDVESYDMTTEIEAIITGQDPTATVAGQEFDFIDSMPVDMLSPFKADGLYNVVKGIAIPYLTLESASYRFGVGENASQTFTFRGDSIYYVPGTPMYTQVALVGGTTTYNLGGTALPYNEQGQTKYVLSAQVKNPTTNLYRRLVRGDDYSDTTTSIVLTKDFTADGYTSLHVVWGTATQEEYPQTVHPTTAVKPAAIRAKDIDVYVQTNEATPTLVRWTGVQSFDINRSVTLENDEEFGNYNFVDQSYDEAEVSGSVTIKPRDLDDLWAKLRQIANVPEGEIIGAHSSVPLGIEIRVSNPEAGGARLKTFYISDARFMLPAISGAVETRQEVTLDWSSDGGQVLIYNGERP